MKRLLLFTVLALLLLTACTPATTEAAPSPTAAPDAQTAATPEGTQAETLFSTEVIDDGTRYRFGALSIDMEYSFEPETVSDTAICLSNGYLDVLISCTDAYDREMFAAYGYDMAAVDLEEFGSILIDANGLDKDSMFYDSFDNLCLRYETPASDGVAYPVLAVVKKAPDHRFWLLQFVGSEAVLEAYMVYLPQWAASVRFD